MFVSGNFGTDYVASGVFVEEVAQPLNVALYIFIQQIQVLNILNMVYTLRFFLFKMQFVSYF